MSNGQRQKHESAVYFFTYVVTWATLLILVLDTGQITSPTNDYLAWLISVGFIIFLIWLYVIPRLTNSARYHPSRDTKLRYKIGLIFACSQEAACAYMLFLTGRAYEAHYQTLTLNAVISEFCSILRNCPLSVSKPLPVFSLNEVYFGIAEAVVGMILSAIGFAQIMYYRGLDRGTRKSIQRADPVQIRYA